MQKYFVSRADVTIAANPQIVSLLEAYGPGLIVRFFRVVEIDGPSAEALSAVPPVAPISWEPYATLGGAGALVSGSAISEVPSLAGATLREIERQTLNPQSIATGGDYGSAELYDFASIVLPVDFDGGARPPINSFVEGATAKAGIRRVGWLRESIMSLICTATHVESPVEEWTLVRVAHPLVAFVDRTPGAWTTAPSGFSVFSTLPSVEIDAPATVALDGSATVEVRVVNPDGSPCLYDGDLVVEALAGYAAKRRVSIEGGVGSLRVLPLGLEAGDVIRVKVGTRLITGLADASISVVAA
jgi:hypothetical protein